jgi:hypothetical protein
MAIYSDFRMWFQITTEYEANGKRALVPEEALGWN